MKPFDTFEGITVPFDRANIDTDAIIPKQFLKSIQRTGFGPNLFDEWRYLDHGEPGQDSTGRLENPDFILNQGQYRSAKILLARQNFGCGSSREHAVWALRDYGIRALIAPSFADIFFNNCFKNGVLPAVLPAEEVDQLFRETAGQDGYSLTVNLEEQTILTSNGQSFRFEVGELLKYRLINGLDDIDLTMQHREKIQQHEEMTRSCYPWLFEDIA
jgi:3-isopropylmalate/(R)-2-methylmalate dehydratase small subunit